MARWGRPYQTWCGSHHPTSEIGCPLIGVWGGASKLWIDITSAVMAASDSLFDSRGMFWGQAIQWRHSRGRGSKGRLATLGLDRLELRRLRFDLIYVYKILFGMVETAASIFFRVRNTNRLTVTRGHSLKLFVPKSRLDVRKYLFCHRIVLRQMIFHH